ncbi:histidine phosphatase family protein [Paenibacillus alvei]|uniref:Histidine phosphatase family protein n=1 Tax=Paenibacillus alvei TaxID=44250 RepID=A0AAP7A3A8_PAEAL|nr:histidine phosphatase family protein [Paenibacillus alvei]MBG9735487.1 phosphoglycerate mutase [Paenibacillus alvei]MBG9746783.1 phosphoglycerate mutase [Paenibacillus alvei]MCY9578573.1 histidine phosphatase family protein [Paenibacillus alvei]MCY9584894.1 histidine phosphatase family protein [Paenibacillus alvei]NEZ44096.1 histidine phosphatase family protein [Paenibacillus alvei]
MSKKTTLYIVRHGETEWNVERRMQGHMDSPLTTLGVSQAQWLGEAMKDTPIDCIYASSSGRTDMTARLIRGERDIPMISSDALKEIHLGDWEGQLAAELERTYPEQFEAFWYEPAAYKSENGETFEELRNRVLPYVQSIIADNPGKSILVVTHTVVVKTLMAYFEHRLPEALWDPPYIQPASLSQVEIELEGEKVVIVRHGDTSHYKTILQD